MKPATVRLLIVAAFLVLAPVIGRKSKSRFTNLKCESYDPSFSTFKKCKLNVLGRGVVAVDININLLKLPIYNVHVSVTLLTFCTQIKMFITQTDSYPKASLSGLSTGQRTLKKIGVVRYIPRYFLFYLTENAQVLDS